MSIRTTLSLFSTFALLLIGLTSVPAHAQKPDSASQQQAVRATFDSLVTAHSYALTLHEGDLRGQGVEWLVDRAQSAHHFMIGERHGTAEIPAFAGALYERLEPVGYEYAALEIGPFGAKHVNESLNSGGFDALANLITSYEAAPFAFLDWREESRMAARIAEAGGTIWGLDQEFASSLPLHLDALSDRATTERERTAVADLWSQMQEEWMDDQSTLGNADPEALQSLRRAFEARGDEKALARIDALITSNEIYAPYTRDTGSFYHSGVDRENYMKRTLADYVRHAEERSGKAPRVFYKFGGLHSGRHSGANVDPRVTLGTFVSEWARTLRGEESFHLFVDCNGGQNRRSGQGAGGTCTPALTAADGSEGKESPFSKHLSDDRLTLIDLSALRARFSDFSFLSERAQTMVIAFDAYVAIPDVHPSTPFKRSEEETE